MQKTAVCIMLQKSKPGWKVKSIVSYTVQKRVHIPGTAPKLDKD